MQSFDRRFESPEQEVGQIKGARRLRDGVVLSAKLAGGREGCTYLPLSSVMNLIAMMGIISV